jgi:hypothetical protein
MFSPSYGFPTDVISFHNRALEDQEDRRDESYFWDPGTRDDPERVADCDRDQMALMG